MGGKGRERGQVVPQVAFLPLCTKKRKEESNKLVFSSVFAISSVERASKHGVCEEGVANWGERVFAN